MIIEPDRLTRAKTHIGNLVREIPGTHPIVRNDETGAWECLRHPDCRPVLALRATVPPPKGPTDVPTTDLDKLRTTPSGVTIPIEVEALVRVADALAPAVANLRARREAQSAETGTPAPPSTLESSLVQARADLLKAITATTTVV